VSATQQLATLGTVMAALQHRINNSLSLIVPNVDRLRRRIPEQDELTSGILDIIERNARQTSEMIGRIQAQLRVQTPKTLELNSTLNYVANETQSLYPDSPVRFHVELDDSIPLITASTGQLTEVFTNLVQNAHRAMPDGGDLTIKSTRRGNTIQVRVQDTGSGIPARIQDRLFKLPVPSEYPEHGSGLGLWLSKLMLQTIGGDLQVEQTGPEGTTMLVEVPIERPANRPNARDSA
jgi:signal transduction histidine kinase